MTKKTRYLADTISADLKEKMVFLGGPRQVGKTTLALQFLEPPTERNQAYLSWDNLKVRSQLLKGDLPAGQKLIVLDEVHKFLRWRNLVKGFYDTYKSEIAFLVTGSARLDHYRKGGDSLQGRYHYLRLHPFSLMEMSSNPNREDLELLMKYGGFPEPLSKANERSWRRWSLERTQRVLREDLRDLEAVRDVSMLELLVESLPDRVGSPLSIQSIRELLSVAHETVERWISILEALYFCFRIPPFGAPKIKAVKKERKLYFWDWSQIPDPGARFENLVASHLLKYCHWWEDVEGYRMELRYIRDVEKREVDFVVLKQNKPLFAVECKTGEKAPSPAIRYFRERTGIPKFYQVHLGVKDYGNENATVRVLPFATFCKELEIP